MAWRNPQNIADLLISDINDVINGVSTLRENGSETIPIDIEPDLVTFYPENVSTNFPKIPTSEFLQIIIAWADFLRQNPTDGTIVQ